MVKYEKFDDPMEDTASGQPEFESLPKPEERCEEALERASNFFSTELDDSVGVEDQNQWPTIEQPLLLWRWRVRRCVESFPCRLLIILMILVDLGIIVSGIVAPPKSAAVASLVASIDMSLSVLFVMEVSLRFFALGCKEFIGKWYHVLDAIIVYATAFIAFLDLLLETTLPIKSLRLIAILRLLRVVRLVRLCTEKKNLENGVRKMVSQNKRRFQQDGFDLDLTYVTERMIAMSYPSTGSMAMYRNPAAEVARFLDLKHKDCYKVYNLCSERSYDPSLFHHRVERYMIDDHNVPTVKEMVYFSDSVRQWLEQNPQHVAVVHCKGGKGRTGTLVCVWLVEAGLFNSARDSLGYFGQRRTDFRVGRAFQGVETPSQSRYVGYYERVKATGLLPEETPLVFRGLKLTGLMNVGRGDGSDFSLEVQPGRDKPSIFSAHFGKLTNCQVGYDSEMDELSVNLLNCPLIKADTKLLFHCDSSNVPKGYENSAFYLWFHTGFIENNRLCLCREELDNPHKTKTWNVFGARFGLEMFFTPPEF